MKVLAPIIVVAYNRPTHLARTLESLCKNDYAQDSILYIYCDGPKPFEKTESSMNDRNCVGYQSNLWKFYGTNIDYEEYLSKINETRNIATKITGFKEVNVIKRDANMGLADNIVSAVTEIVNKYGKVIVFEDDIVSTKGCLKYLNDALNLYENDEKVMHVSAYTYPHKCKLPESFFFYTPYPAGGWATWDRAWKNYIDDTQYLVDYWKNDWKSFNVIGQEHLQKQLLLNLNGVLKTWYIKWYASIRILDGLCLYPSIAMTQNIGMDGTGTTSILSDQLYVKHLAEYTNVNRIKIECNKKGAHMMKIKASGHWYSRRYRIMWKNKIKYFIKKIFV